MPESVSVMEDKGIIQIRSWGHVTREDMRVTTQEIIAIHRRHGFTKIFVDMRKVAKLPSTVDLFDAAINSRKLAGGLLRTAVLVSEGVKADRHFAETVAVNRGSVERMFDTKQEALVWLGE